MPIYPRRIKLSAGFTLIEMLVVLAILSLLAAILASNIGKGPDMVVRQQAASTIKAAIQNARRAAGRSGQIQQVAPDHLVPGTALQSPDLPMPDAGVRSLAIYPDGSTSGGQILMDGRPLLTVDWLTGVVADAR